MKYDDVYGALRDHETFSSVRPPDGPISGPAHVLIEDDPPRHTRFRRLVNKAFTVRRIEAADAVDYGCCQRASDRLALAKTISSNPNGPSAGQGDRPSARNPGEEHESFKRWSAAFISFSAADRTENTQKREEMVAYLGKMAAAQRAQGAEDLITALVEAEVEGEKLEEWEILGFCILLLIAGNETTTNLIGNTLNALAERPGLWEQLREDRSLVETVIEETSRYESPVQRLSRYTTRDIEVSGVRIPAGDIVRIYFGAANRDPEEFSNPDEFRLDRDLRNHVGFGMGIHYCLGAPLARAEAKITLNAFLDRYSEIKRGPIAGGTADIRPVIFGFQHLPLVLER